MDLKTFLQDKSVKPLEKRKKLVNALRENELAIGNIEALTPAPDAGSLTVILEALEETSRFFPECATADLLIFAGRYVTADSNGQKRESSRIAGNLAARFPSEVGVLIPACWKIPETRVP